MYILNYYSIYINVYCVIIYRDVLADISFVGTHLVFISGDNLLEFRILVTIVRPYVLKEPS
jgi:hypothetical protein